ncbi:MAG: hypothetical protein IPP90_21260 [Gemmatimonadaceae bacterium]|nr:hypothetical protein [Gemmatimonadaceae bacterium]
MLRLRRNLRPGSDIGLIVLDREVVGGGLVGTGTRVAGVTPTSTARQLGLEQLRCRRADAGS